MLKQESVEMKKKQHNHVWIDTNQAFADRLSEANVTLSILKNKEKSYLKKQSICKNLNKLIG
jgi:hypothetical protein